MGTNYYHGDSEIEKILFTPTICEDYRDNKDLRNKFYHFTQAVFPGLNFTDWYKQGYWSKKYIPFSVIEDNKIISNVSISKMKIIVNGDYLKGIQIGTVGTLPEYRNRGLSKFLMEYVLHKFDNVSDIFFLFANDTVLDFYPKFGFIPYNEVIFKSFRDIPGSNYCARKLDISDNADLSIIKRCLKKRLALTKLFGASDYNFITHWHLLNVFPDNLFFIEDDHVILICKEENNRLHIWDVIYSEPVNLSAIVPKIIRNKNLQSIHYYFPPDQLEFNYDEVIPDKESYLFVRGDFEINERNFKFPITAQT